MYFLKRACKYLINKKGRTILLGIIFLVIANFVLAGLLVQNASEKAEEQTRLSIGSDISFIVDLDAFFMDAEKGIIDRKIAGNVKGSIFEGRGILNSEVFTEKGAPTYANFMKVIDSEYVESYDISVTFGLFSQDGYKNYVLDTGGKSATSSFAASLYASVQPRDFRDGSSELTDGRMATEEEISSGANVILIEESVADINNLSTGDMLRVKTSLEDYEDVIMEYEIIGIYLTNQEFTPGEKGYSPLMLPQNRVYIPFNNLLSIGLSQEYINNIVVPSNIIYLDDPDNLENYRSEINEKLDFKYGRLDANDDLYNSLMAPIENLGSVSKMLVLIISIAGALIIGLITALTVNERKEEIGILLAIGESKMKVVSQFIVEVIIIAVIAFSLSTFTGGIIGRNISDLVLNSEMLQAQTEEKSPIKEFINKRMYNQKQEEINKIREEDAVVDINLNASVLMQLFGLGLLLSIVSTATPSLYVMRFNPKQILTNRNS